MWVTYVRGSELKEETLRDYLYDFEGVKDYKEVVKGIKELQSDKYIYKVVMDDYGLCDYDRWREHVVKVIERYDADKITNEFIIKLLHDKKITFNSYGIERMWEEIIHNDFFNDYHKYTIDDFDFESIKRRVLIELFEWKRIGEYEGKK